MVELAVGDLYDQIASRHEGIYIHPQAVYECKYCDMFEITGAALRGSDKGRCHAAAHRIAFEALLEPAPVLICPICDMPQKTSDVACIFGCMFNDLDLVDHLERDHSDILSDDMVCDFSDPRYLLTTFQQKQPSKSSLQGKRASDETGGTRNDDDDEDDRTTITLSDGDGDSRSPSPGGSGVEAKHCPNDATGAPDGEVREDTGSPSGDVRPMDGESAAQSGPSVDKSAVNSAEEVTNENGNGNDANDERDSQMDSTGPPSNEKGTQEVPPEEPRRRRHMDGVSIITCLACDWSPSDVRSPGHLRDEVSSHVRLHIREESSKLPSRADSFFGDKRLLSCMDFSLEEYFEKEHLTDLSGTINSRIMEKVYGEILAKLFGVCVPLVYRILHGNNGNPFRSPESYRTRRKKYAGSKPRVVNETPRPPRRSTRHSRATRSRSNSTVSTECFSSDADGSSQEPVDLLGIASLESDEHIQCARPECGHFLLTTSDHMAIVRHVAAHIRHDEARLLKTAGASPLVACDCGMAIGSPMGYVYHIVHDHVFEKKKFTDLAATIVAYLMLIVETAIESVLAVRVEFRATRWTLWCAYFSLENDEGDENLFADSTDLNEHWWKLWENLLDECMTGKSMTLGDTIKLFEMHPFVDETRLRTRKHKSIPVMDGASVQRSLGIVWAYVNRWSNDPMYRVELASESRWIRIAQIRRRAFLESKKCEQDNTDSWHSLTLCSTPSTFEIEKQQPVVIASQPSPAAVQDSDADSSTSVAVNGSSAAVLDEPHQDSSNTASTDAAQLAPDVPSSSSKNAQTASEVSGRCSQEKPTAAAESSGKFVHCTICANVCISAEDTTEIKNHCALHAALEGRMLCSLYIHRAADRPQMCPYCTTEMNVYKPTEFLDHLRARHMKKTRIIYDKHLSRYFPESKIFTAPIEAESHSHPEETNSGNDFIIRCQRSECCGVDPVIVLPADKAIPLSNVDIAVVKHILWHVRNDSFLESDPIERELLTRALMIRLSSAQMRQILFMARRVTKQFSRYKEADVVKYIQEKMDEIGCILFGINKGLVFQMVFTRRFVRDQSGMQLYPPCVCRLCVDKELPRYSSDRRKRAFVAYAHPVVIHILEHLSAGQLPEHVNQLANTLKWETSCSIDGLRFKNVSMAVKHVLDAHNDFVELSALDMVLEDMGLFGVFRSAMAATLGEQAWQLEEALGFGAYNMKTCPKPTFLNEPPNGGIHRPDCYRAWDPTTQMCSCAELAIQEASSADGSSHPKPRLRGTSLQDMPEASAACYAEFLNESESPDGDENITPSSMMTSAGNESTTEPPALQTPSSFLENVVSQTASLAAIKAEPPDEAEERSDFNNLVPALSGELRLPMPDLSTNAHDDGSHEGRLGSSRKKKPPVFKRAKQKRSREIKREVDGVILPQRNKALPLKNIIQGSKTVAAALAAALDSPTTATEGPSSRAAPEEGTSSGATASLSSKKNANNTDSEERELALGGVTKKPRLSGTANEAPDTTESISGSDYSRRRLRATSGRRKSTVHDASTDK